MDALLALRGQGGMVFGMASGSLQVTDEQRANLARQASSALLQIHRACVASGDTEMLGELSKVAESCALPGLRSPGVPIAKMTHPQADWLEVAPSGVFALRRSSDEWVQQLVEWFDRCYEGPDFGGGSATILL